MWDAENERICSLKGVSGGRNLGEGVLVLTGENSVLGYQYFWPMREFSRLVSISKIMIHSLGQAVTPNVT